MRVVGIDPGQSGGIGFATDEGLVDLIAMPLRKPRSAKVIDFMAVGRYVESCRPDRVYVELQFNTNSFGAKSTGTKLFNYGRLIQILEVVGYTEASDTLEVLEQKDWKDKMIPDRDDGFHKEDAIRVCKDLFPNQSLLPTPKCSTESDGMADAALITTCGFYLMERCK